MSGHGKYAVLASRGVVRVGGADARGWLQGLVTNDVESLPAGEARFAALLSPQGKILFDFFVIPDGDGLLIDCAADQIGPLLRRLAMYKLRAQATLADVSSALGVAAAWGGEPPAAAQGRVFADPRDPRLGWRALAPMAELEKLGEPAAEADWRAHRIACGVPEGGADFAWGDVFPHEANMDRLHGIDFRKGCYVGQEVVSRVQHRGLARKRFCAATLDAPAPAPGTDVTAGDAVVGTLAGSAGAFALALLRLDKVDDARAAGLTLRCGAANVTLPDEAARS